MQKLSLHYKGPKISTGRQTCSTCDGPFHTESLVSPVATLNMSPQDNVTSWMSSASLINQQDGCLRTVAQQATQGRLRQEQLAQTVAHSATMPSQNDQVQYLRAQLKHVRSECDTHFAQEEELLAHMCLLSTEAKDWKPEWQAKWNSGTSAMSRIHRSCSTCH